MEDQNQSQQHGQTHEVIGVILIEVVEIEEYAKHGHPVPHAKRYAFRVDKDRIVIETPTITGAEILAKVGKTPDRYKLYQHKRHHQPVLIGPNQEVDLRAPGVERFTTMPKDTTEGRETLCLKQEFQLPAADEEYLNGRGLEWETIRDGATQWLIIQGWKVPTGYNQAEVKLALLIPPSYSDSQLDMVYFSPALHRMDGRPIGALSPQVIQGEVYQRWSRHRTSENPWRAGVDDVGSHLALVDEWLRREFEKV